MKEVYLVDTVEKIVEVFVEIVKIIFRDILRGIVFLFSVLVAV